MGPGPPRHNMGGGDQVRNIYCPPVVLLLQGGGERLPPAGGGARVPTWWPDWARWGEGRALFIIARVWFWPPLWLGGLGSWNLAWIDLRGHEAMDGEEEGGDS